MYSRKNYTSTCSSQILLLASLPNRTEVCGMLAFVKHPPESSHYAKTAHQWLVLKCRMLIFAENQILSSPVLFSDSNIYIIVSKAYIAAGKFKELLEHHGMSEQSCQRVPVTDSLLQTCLQYSLKARLAPKWNQLSSSYLVQGRDFLITTAAMSAVKLELVVQGDQVIISINPLRMRLPHLQLSDLEIAPDKISSFYSQQTSVLSAHCIGREWLCTLPGLRNGRILSMSHQIPSTCPMLNYREIKRHWKNMYGFRLPEEQPGSLCSPAGPYITITFQKHGNVNVVGYTYPALCVRPHGPIFLPNVDQAIIVQTFAGDLSARLNNLCGIPFELSIRLGRPNSDLMPAHYQLLHTSTSQKTTQANIVNIPLKSLPQARTLKFETSVMKESQSFSQSSQIHTQLWSKPCNYNNNLSISDISTPNKRSLMSSYENNTNYQQKKASSTITSASQNVTESPQCHTHLSSRVNNEISLNVFKHQNYKVPATPKQARMRNEETSLFVAPEQKTGLLCRKIPCLSMATEAEIPGCQNSVAAQPIEGAASNSVKVVNSRCSKWDYPKSASTYPLQDDVVTSTDTEKKLYVPIFTKKKKTGHETKSTKTVYTKMGCRENTTVKNFKPSAAHLPCTKIPKTNSSMDSKPYSVLTVNQSNIKNSKQAETQAAQSPCKATKILRTPLKVDKKLLILAEKNKKVSLLTEQCTPAKKIRDSKSEPTDEDIEQFAHQGKLDHISVQVLTKWLKVHNVPYKARDKKAILIAKIYEFLHVVS